MQKTTCEKCGVAYAPSVVGCPRCGTDFAGGKEPELELDWGDRRPRPLPADEEPNSGSLDSPCCPRCGRALTAGETSCRACQVKPLPRAVANLTAGATLPVPAPEASPSCPRCARPSTGRRCEGCGIALAAGTFSVQRLVSESGQSRTYVARDANGRLVFLKELIFVLVPDTKALDAFAREGELLKQLRHPQIPRYLAHFAEGEGTQLRLYLAEEYVEGPSLLSELETRRHSEEDVRRIGVELLELLTYLHERTPPILHRDVKPANVVRRTDGKLALVDFGAASDGAAPGTTQVGTLGYAPPEQLAGIATPGSDVYGLAATMLHLLTRVPPWEQVTTGFQPTVRSLRISATFSAWLSRALDPRASRRFLSAREARTALTGRASRLRLHSVLVSSLVVLAAGVGLGRKLLHPLPVVHPEGTTETCPEDGFLGGDGVGEQYCLASLDSKRTERHGVSVTYVPGVRPLRPKKVAHYTHGILDGNVTEYDTAAPAVVRSSGEYVAGVQQGTWKGLDGEGNFVGGKKDGKWVRYHFTGGPLAEETHYLNGLKHGTSVHFNSAGLPISERAFQNDRPEGTWTISFGNGKPNTVTTYLGGERDGPFEEYDAEGNKLRSGVYANDREVGWWQDYFPDGSVRLKTRYEGLRKPESIEFYPGGATKAVWRVDFMNRKGSLLEYFEDGTKSREIGPCDELGESLCRTEYYRTGKVASRCGVDVPTSVGSMPQLRGHCTEWHPNEALKAVGEHSLVGKRNGLWKTYWPNGKLQRLESYDEMGWGAKTGEFKQYFETGQLQISGAFVEGRKTGLWIERDSQGEVISQEDRVR